MNELFNSFCYLICLFSSFFSHIKCDTAQYTAYKGIYSQDVTQYEIVVPKRVDEHGKFISNLIPRHYQKRSAKEPDFVFYKIPIEGKHHIIQLNPNLKLISPGAVVEIHRQREERRGDSCGKSGNLFENYHIKKMRNTGCYYSGFVKGMTSKVALSTCFGLAGFIQTGNITYIIEPVSDYGISIEDEHPHILYKNIDTKHSEYCNTTGKSFKSDYRRNRPIRETKENIYYQTYSYMDFPLFLEVLIVLDKNLLNYHNKLDVENYILTTFNMAFNLFHDASLGFLINLSLVRLIRLEIEFDQMNMNVNQDAIQILQNFQDWQYRINPGDDSHPNHHDVAILITRTDIYSNVTQGFLGATTLGSACNKKLSAVLSRDTGLKLGFVIAHEIAHLMGAEHDGYNNSCDYVDNEGFRTVMHPQVLLTTQSWSKCTQGYLKTFLEKGFGHCLYDEPTEHYFSHVQDLLPGAVYDADFQCSQVFGSNVQECNTGSTCDSLNCQIPSGFCVKTKSPPAAGTHCGKNMWCQKNTCLVIGQESGVDGSWGNWSPWSECSRTCDTGVAVSVRYCNRPAPSLGGKYCVGENRRHRICVSSPCEISKRSFRDIQCGEFNDWIFPEDRKNHTWKGYINRYGDPCVLFCINEKEDIVALKPRVIDGTSCYRGIGDICVEGICRTIPCDSNLESNAVEDICGVCHGDGTSCDFSKGMTFMQKLPKVMSRLVNIPVGTKNIKVEQVGKSSARIVVADLPGKKFYLRGTRLGYYYVPGSKAWLGIKEAKQEILTIPGPVTKTFAIWIARLEDVTVKWSMALPVTQARTPKFSWDFIKWSPCSAICGLGTQMAEPSCKEEKAGLVEDSYCADIDMPPIKIRSCEVKNCEPRWMVSDWKECESTDFLNRTERRMVFCVRSVGDKEGSTEIISDENCNMPKPAEEQPCEVRCRRDSSSHLITKMSTSNTLKDIGLRGNQLAMFSSNSMKFGSHKKYDEYLKNFEAISVPQRKAETIPVHLVDTPHFKNYYRVLQKSDDELSSKSNKEKVYNLNLKELKNILKSRGFNFLTKTLKGTFSGNHASYNSLQSLKRISASDFVRDKYSLIKAKRRKVAAIENSKSLNVRRRRNNIKNVSKKGSKSKYLKSIRYSHPAELIAQWPIDILHCTRKKQRFYSKRCRNYKLEKKYKITAKNVQHASQFTSTIKWENSAWRDRDTIRMMRHNKRSPSLSNETVSKLSNNDKNITNNEPNKEKGWKSIKFNKLRRNLKVKAKKPKLNQNSKPNQTGTGENQHCLNFQVPEKDAKKFALEGPFENYSIRFGQIVIDKDENQGLEIFTEENEQDEPNQDLFPHTPSDTENVTTTKSDNITQSMQENKFSSGYSQQLADNNTMNDNTTESKTIPDCN